MYAPYENSNPYPDPSDSVAPVADHVDAQRPMAAAHEDSPRTVIRGKSYPGTPITPAIVMPEGFQPLPGVHPFAAHTDWLNCTIPTEGDSEFHSTFIQQFFDIAGGMFAPMTECGGGLRGWKRSFKMSETGARLAIGGQNDTLFLSLPGYACNLIPLASWPVLATFLDAHYNAQITRWDGAVDDYEGRYSVDWAVEQYQLNQFNAGGNKPSCSQMGIRRGPQAFFDGFYVFELRHVTCVSLYYS
jgi:hypothetical protein